MIPQEQICLPCWSICLLKDKRIYWLCGVLARTCPKKCRLQDWAGTSWLENGQLADLSSVSSFISGSMFGIGITNGKESLESSWVDSNGLHLQNNSNDHCSSKNNSGMDGGWMSWRLNIHAVWTLL